MRTAPQPVARRQPPSSPCAGRAGLAARLAARGERGAEPRLPWSVGAGILLSGLTRRYPLSPSAPGATKRQATRSAPLARGSPRCSEVRLEAQDATEDEQGRKAAVENQGILGCCAASDGPGPAAQASPDSASAHQRDEHRPAAARRRSTFTQSVTPRAMSVGPSRPATCREFALRASVLRVPARDSSAGRAASPSCARTGLLALDTRPASR